MSKSRRKAGPVSATPEQAVERDPPTQAAVEPQRLNERIGGGDAGSDADDPTVLGMFAQMLGGGHIPVDDGSDALAANGANAAATPAGLLLGKGGQSDAILAEEAVHWMQFGLGGGGGAATSQPDDPAELEAAWIANQMMHGEQPDMPRQRPTGRMMRNVGPELQPQRLVPIGCCCRFNTICIHAMLNKQGGT